MDWKSVAWAGCLVPVLAGCGSLRHTSPRVTDEVTPGLTRRGGERDQRAANDAWQAVCTRHMGRAFSDEFRGGFLDGYATYLERGPDAKPPAVPPAEYTRDANPAGSIRDYYLGFRYATDVAVASGRRPLASEAPAPGPVRAAALAPAVPFVQPVWSNLNANANPKPAPGTSDTGTGANKFSAKPAGAETQPPLPGTESTGRVIPPLPKPELPVIKPYNPALPGDGGTKFAPLLMPPDPDRLPIPSPPVPVPEPFPAPSGPSISPPLPAPAPSIFVEPHVIPFQFAAPMIPTTSASNPRK